MQRKIKAIAIAYNPHLSRAIALLGALAAVCLFLYAFFLLEAVAHTASRTHAQSEIKTLTSKLSTLEQAYLADTRGMTLERAGELGLVAPAEVSVVYVSDPAHALSLRTR